MLVEFPDTTGRPTGVDPTGRIRVGYERTAMQLDRSGTARATASLRDALTAIGSIELIDLEHPWSNRNHGRIRRGLDRELRYLPRELPRRVTELELDVLHCPAALPPPRGKVPLVVTVNDVLAWDHPHWIAPANLLQQRMIARRALMSATRLITPSRFSRDRVVSRLGIDPGRVTVVPYGVHPQFSPGPAAPSLLEALGLDRPFFLCVATLQPRKNVPAAIAAFEEAQSGIGDHELVIAGAGGFRSAPVRKRAARSAATARIHVLGRVSDDELVSLYRAATALIFPSLYEGFGFPMVEAMACGAPVVAHRDGPASELVGEAGTLVDARRPVELAGALRALASSPGHRAELADAARARVARFDWAACSRATAEVYHHAAAARV